MSGCLVFSLFLKMLLNIGYICLNITKKTETATEEVNLEEEKHLEERIVFVA